MHYATSTTFYSLDVFIEIISMQARSYISVRETPIKDEVQLTKRKERMSSRRRKKVIKKRKKRSADALEIVIVFSSALLAERFGTFFSCCIGRKSNEHLDMTVRAGSDEIKGQSTIIGK